MIRKTDVYHVNASVKNQVGETEQSETKIGEYREIDQTLQQSFNIMYEPFVLI